MALGGAQRGATPPRSQEVGENAKAAKKSAMQSLLGVDLFGTHGDDMKQISDRKEHQTQNRIRGEYENREGPWRGDSGPRVHDSTHFFSTKTSPRHDGSSIADYFVDKPEQDQAKYWRNYDIERSLAPELAPRDEYEASLKIQRVARKWLARRRNAARRTFCEVWNRSRLPNVI